MTSSASAGMGRGNFGGDLEEVIVFRGGNIGRGVKEVGDLARAVAEVEGGKRGIGGWEKLRFRGGIIGT